MSKNFIVSAAANREMRDIFSYIAQDNFSASVRMREKVYEAFAQLGEHPSMGQQRHDLTRKNIRFWPVHASYMIIYDHVSQPIRILRILHSARHFPTILQ